MEQRRRRDLLVAGIALAAFPASGAGKKAKEDQEVSPGEDLMREHGVLNRVLLVYDEGIRRLESGEDGRLDLLAAAAGLIRGFIEGYHEKLEEEFVFPRFRKAKKLVELVDTLQAQHEAGRRVTAALLQAPTPQLLRNFARMYRPHEAREDTELFPAFRELAGEREYRRLGDRFEEREHHLFGEKGFEGKVDEVARIKQALGIHDLAQFTPK